MQPQKLSQGDVIAIVAPAKKIDETYIERATRFLESHGLKVITGQNVLQEHHQFAGNDTQRAQDLNEAIANPNVKAILCARGGYGTVRIINKIDFSPLNTHPKLIIGFSDITVLHNHIHTHLGTETLHATVPVNFPEAGTNENLKSLIHALFEGSTSYQVDPHPLNKPGKVQGKLIGGNLAILESLTGTDSDIDTNGKILFMEEVSEYAYRVDRMLYTLKKAGKLDGLTGLVVGSFTDIKEGKDHFGKAGYEMVQEIITDYDFPVCYDFPAGHGTDNRAIFLGRETQLVVNAGGATLNQ
jgi:muramoyltetrapeptide carboxypeptidase